MKKEKFYKNSQQQYVYSELSKPSMVASEPVNVYGIIIDASAPYSKNDKAMCNIKIIDQSTNLKAALDNSNTFIQLTIFQKSELMLPQIFTVGDIIRLNRVNIGQFKGQKQFNANFASSWLIFKGSELLYKANQDLFYSDNIFIQKEDKKQVIQQNLEILQEIEQQKYFPIDSQHKQFSFHDSEKQILDNIRQWSLDYFQQNMIYDTKTNYQRSEIQNNGFVFYRDFDLIGKIIQIIEKDDQFSNIIVKDLQGQAFQLRINKSKFNHIKLRDVVRIRSVQLSDTQIIDSQYNQGTQFNPIIIQQTLYTNILIIPEFFKQAMMLNERVIDDQTIQQLMVQPISLKDQNMQILKKPLIITEIDPNYQDMQTTTLYDLFHLHNKELESKQFFKLNVFLIGILPMSSFELTQLYCAKCKESFSFKMIECYFDKYENELYYCQKCGNISEPIYQICFFVKDDSTLGINKCYKIYYYNYDQNNYLNFFRGIKPQNLYKHQDVKEQLEKFINLISQFNIYLQIIVRKKICINNNEIIFELFDGKIKNS